MLKFLNDCFTNVAHASLLCLVYVVQKRHTQLTHNYLYSVRGKHCNLYSHYYSQTVCNTAIKCAPQLLQVLRYNVPGGECKR